ncbi:MAG: hypothetical protein ABMB14_17145 [Myxococcota bacterium]
MVIVMAAAMACDHPSACRRSCDEGDFDACLSLSTLLLSRAAPAELDAEDLAHDSCSRGLDAACILLARLELAREGMRDPDHRIATHDPPEAPFLDRCSAGDLEACSAFASELGPEYFVSNGRHPSDRAVVAHASIVSGLRAAAVRRPELLLAVGDREALRAAASQTRDLLVAGEDSAWLRLVRDGEVDVQPDWSGYTADGVPLVSAVALRFHDVRFVDPRAAREAEQALEAVELTACRSDPAGLGCARATFRSADRFAACGEETCRSEVTAHLESLCRAGAASACAGNLEVPCTTGTDCQAAWVRERKLGAPDTAYRSLKRLCRGDGTPECVALEAGAEHDPPSLRFACQTSVADLCPLPPPSIPFVDLVRASDAGDPVASLELARLMLRDPEISTDAEDVRACGAGCTDRCRSVALRMSSGTLPGGAQAAFREFDALCVAGHWGDCVSAARAHAQALDDSAQRVCGSSEFDACDAAVAAARDQSYAQALADSAQRACGSSTLEACRAAMALRPESAFAVDLQLVREQEAACRSGDLERCRRIAYFLRPDYEHLTCPRGTEHRACRAYAEQQLALLSSGDPAMVAACARSTGEASGQVACETALAWSFERSFHWCLSDSRCLRAAERLRRRLPAREPDPGADRERCDQGDPQACLRGALAELVSGHPPDAADGLLWHGCHLGSAPACGLWRALTYRKYDSGWPDSHPGEACPAGGPSHRATVPTLREDRTAEALALRRRGCEAGHGPSCLAWYDTEGVPADQVLASARQRCDGGDVAACLWAIASSTDKDPWIARFEALARAACASGDRDACPCTPTTPGPRGARQRHVDCIERWWSTDPGPRFLDQCGAVLSPPLWPLQARPLPSDAATWLGPWWYR